MFTYDGDGDRGDVAYIRLLLFKKSGVIRLGSSWESEFRFVQRRDNGWQSVPN